MKILYGVENNTIDVTDICLTQLKNENIITIPSGDGNRAHFFTDPLHGISKKIFVVLDIDNITEYNDKVEIYIYIIGN